MKVKIVNHSPYPLPAYATELSAGMDLRADLQEPLVLGSLERAMVPTGLHIELPAGFEAQIRPRSGLAAKHGISIVNAPGTIDADYRGASGLRRWSLPATRRCNGSLWKCWRKATAEAADSVQQENKTRP